MGVTHETERLLPDGAKFGNLTVMRLLGRGGMGEVYLCENSLEGALYALKVFAPQDEKEGVRFIREANAAQSLHHPNLLDVYDAGVDPATQLCYLVMEYMPHGSLRDEIAAAPQGLPFARIVRVLADVAAALAVIDANGMVHRDVKPDNILVASDGTAKLGDLGMTKNTDGDEPDVNVTRAEDVVGTPAYMAPEQMLDSRTVDARADIYSLGAVLFEMLTGHRPNEGESAMTVLARALDGHPPPDPRDMRKDCPAPLATLAMSMLMPNAVQRPANAKAVLWHLARPDSLARETLRDEKADAVPWYADRSVLYACVALVFSLEVLVVALVSAFARR